MLEQGFAGFAASRTYYTTFYVASALLLTKNLKFSKHSAVIAAFGKEFARTNEALAKLHRYLIDAESVRNMGDYDITIDITEIQAATIIAWAREAIDATRQVLGEAKS